MTEYWPKPRNQYAAVEFDVRTMFSRGGVVSVWAGDELDPCYLTPAEARQAAAEWPAILLRLAGEAEQIRKLTKETMTDD